MSRLLLLDDLKAINPVPTLVLPIDKREAQNWQSRRNYIPICVVEHIGVASTFDGLVNYLVSANVPQVSATFVIGGDYIGQFALLVGSGENRELNAEKLLRAANHCGIQSFPNNNPRPNINNSNWFTWGKEHVGYPGQVWTPVMLQNDILCNAWVSSVLGHSAFTYITGHNDFDPINRAHCPGPTFPWTEIYNIKLPMMLSRPVTSQVNLTKVMQSIPKDKLEALPIGDHAAYNDLLNYHLVGVR